MMRTLRLLAMICVPTFSQAEEQVQTSKWYIHIEFPEKFVMDPLSHEGERKWWAKYDDPDSGLSISTNSYGYINDLDLLLTVPGWDHDNFSKKVGADQRPTEEIIASEAKHKTVESYFLSEILPARHEKIDFRHYVRYITRTDSSVSVFYFNKAHSTVTYGQCYETLSFHFPKDSYPKHEKVVSKIIASARPWLSRYKNEDGTDQPADALESETSGNKNLKPQAEGRESLENSSER